MDLKDLLWMLDSENDTFIQQKGIELAGQIGHIADFILPMYPKYNKNIWENCAKIIIQKTDSELAPYLVRILEWLQDLNWPGSFIILNRLLCFDGELLAKAYVDVSHNTFRVPEENNEWLDHLSKLIENKDFARNLNNELYDQIKVRYQNFWQKQVF